MRAPVQKAVSDIEDVLTNILQMECKEHQNHRQNVEPFQHLEQSFLVG